MAPAETRPRANVHPFPARMAPDLALDKIKALTSAGDIVLDPMCGSGTVPRLAALAGRRAIASDIDPLAVMMTRSSCKTAWARDLQARASALVDTAGKFDEALPRWIAHSPESVAFVEYWFGSRQRLALSRLARALASKPSTDDPLRVALSRIIVTKESAASLARDTSHSRPHRVQNESDFDVFKEFVRSAARIEKLVAENKQQYTPSIRTMDARSISYQRSGTVDLTVTSPPYLNAIDYLRGHRMSLVWLGWNVQQLRQLRRESIGSERILATFSEGVAKAVGTAVPEIDRLSRRERGMILRFANDAACFARSLGRVTKLGGHLVLVVADSLLKGVPVSNSKLCRAAAVDSGFKLIESVERPLPMQHRYLPPPEKVSLALGTRMRHEVVLTFVKDG